MAAGRFARRRSTRPSRPLEHRARHALSRQVFHQAEERKISTFTAFVKRQDEREPWSVDSWCSRFLGDALAANLADIVIGDEGKSGPSETSVYATMDGTLEKTTHPARAAAAAKNDI